MKSAGSSTGDRGAGGEPFVSLVVPVYNGARYLRECLDSLLAQTWPHCEILVMDDASTDDTPRVAAAYGEAIQYHRQRDNRGQFRNVEDGIARARGKYVAVYHADDVYDPTIVAEEVAALESDGRPNVVFVLDRFMDAAGRVYGHLRLPPEFHGRRWLDPAAVFNGVLTHKNVFMPTPGAMARAEAFRRSLPFRTEYGSAADLDMWLRLARSGGVAMLHRHLFNYRHTASSVGQAYQRLRTGPENYFALMDAHLAAGAGDGATPAARRAHEAHRAVDQLRMAVNAYIQHDLSAARRAWGRVTPATLLGSGRIRRPRHLVLWALLAVCCRLPRVPALARALHWRYYGRLPWWGADA